MYCVKCKKRTRQLTNERQRLKTTGTRNEERALYAERLKRSLLKRQLVVLC